MITNLITDTDDFTFRVQQKAEENNRFLQSGAMVKTPASDKGSVKLTRTKQWTEDQLSRKSCNLEEIIGFIGQYEGLRLTAATLAILSGVTADKDVTFDASGFDFVPGVTQFTEENLEQAVQVNPSASVLAVHTAVYHRMIKNSLLDSDENTGFRTIGKLTVVFDDNLPKIGNVYDSYLLSPGALELEWGAQPKNATEVQDILGTPTVLSRTWSYTIHPVGYEYVGGRDPSNLVLSDPASWKRVGDIKIVRFRTREA